MVSVLMNSQRTVRFVQPNSNPRNKKGELSNAVALWLEKEEVGFQPTEMETRGKYILGVLTCVFWIIDRHSHTLTDRSYSLPSIILVLTVF